MAGLSGRVKAFGPLDFCSVTLGVTDEKSKAPGVDLVTTGATSGTDSFEKFKAPGGEPEPEAEGSEAEKFNAPGSRRAGSLRTGASEDSLPNDNGRGSLPRPLSGCEGVFPKSGLGSIKTSLSWQTYDR